jgi:serine-type D-Ala-D-Ala carboxypeptidase/endopeptidase (penicillin-binding protein 4)
VNRFGEAGLRRRAWQRALTLGASILWLASATQAQSLPRRSGSQASAAKAGPKPQAPRPKAPRPKPQTSDARYQALSRQLTEIFDAPTLERAFLSVVVRSLSTGETIFARNAGKLMMPASNMKVVTLAAVAERLGWDYRFETRTIVFSAAPKSAADGPGTTSRPGTPRRLTRWRTPRIS